jgi:hypothetical protein
MTRFTVSSGGRNGEEKADHITVGFFFLIIIPL